MRFVRRCIQRFDHGDSPIRSLRLDDDYRLGRLGPDGDC